MESKKEFKTPSLGYSAFVLAALAISTFVQFKILGASLNVTMFLNWLLMTLLALPLGFTYDDLEKKAAENLAGVLTTLFIMYAIGCLAGSWMASGTVPAIIYYGMDLMNAKFFLPTSLVLCSIVSVATGTSWGTLGNHGYRPSWYRYRSWNPGWYDCRRSNLRCMVQGDKISPLSDTTNFTAGIVGTKLATHVKHMMYTTGPAYLATLVIFTVLGLRTAETSNLDTSLILETQQGIADTFHLGFPVLIPVLAVLVMLLLRMNATLSLLVGAFVGSLVAILYQGSTTALAFNCLYNGFKGTFESEFLTSLLNRGGITSMLSTTMTVIFCVGIGGMMKAMGVIQVLVNYLTKLIHTTFSLVLISEVIAYLAQMLSGSHYFSDVILNSTMLDIYKEKGLKPENLSRVMEDCNTIGGTMIPWSSTGLYIVGTLGVAFTEYFPFVFLCYLTPIMGLICAATGWGIARYKEGELHES